MLQTMLLLLLMLLLLRCWGCLLLQTPVCAT
jgi:hypothetical protein